MAGEWTINHDGDWGGEAFIAPPQGMAINASLYEKCTGDCVDGNVWVSSVKLPAAVLMVISIAATKSLVTGTVIAALEQL